MRFKDQYSDNGIFQGLLAFGVRYGMYVLEVL